MTADPPLPRSIRRGPRITLTCKCGERAYVHYGEQWTCEKCGRRWDTRRIPLEQYAAIRATQLRYRRAPLALAVVSLLCVVAFVIAGKAVAGVIVVGIAATSWNILARPIHKRRYREALSNLPSWEIEPEK